MDGGVGEETALQPRGIFYSHITHFLCPLGLIRDGGRPIKSQREAGRLSAMSEGERPPSCAVEAGGRVAGLGWWSWRPMPFTESRVIAKVGGWGGGFAAAWRIGGMATRAPVRNAAPGLPWKRAACLPAVTLEDQQGALYKTDGTNAADIRHGYIQEEPRGP